MAAEAARFADLSLPVHADVIPGAGAMGGVYTALEVATSDRVLVVACDLPFLDELMLGRLVELAAAADGAWVRTPGVSSRFWPVIGAKPAQLSVPRSWAAG